MEIALTAHPDNLRKVAETIGFLYESNLENLCIIMEGNDIGNNV